MAGSRFAAARRQSRCHWPKFTITRRAHPLSFLYHIRDSSERGSATATCQYNQSHTHTHTHFTRRFIDKVCTESAVTQEHIKNLHSMIPGTHTHTHIRTHTRTRT